jgi:hypothetical protein
MTPTQEQLNQQLWSEGKFDEYAAGMAKRAVQHARAAEICFNHDDPFNGSAHRTHAESLRDIANWRPA